MNYENIVSDLGKKIYKPVYLLYGEESYFIDEITNFIAKNVLLEAERSFNQTILYGKDISVVDLTELCRKFPMMSNYQVVIVREAQDLKNVKDIDVYLENPMKSTILVLSFKNTKSVDKRLKFYKQINQKGLVFESKKLYEKDIYQWISTYLKKHELTIHPEALRLLYESIGSDLSRLSNCLDKLRITLFEGQKQIQTEDISRNIGLHRDFNVFELQKAIGTKDSYKAYKIVDYFGKDPRNNPMILNIVQLFDYFLKIMKYHRVKDKSKSDIASELGIHPYFVSEYANAARNYDLRKLVAIISYLREYDLKSKGVEANSIPEGDLMKELVYKILH